MPQTSGASSAEKPFFRYDLETTAVVEGGNRYVDVSCPKTGSSFRFFEVEYAVACGMDGQRDLAGLVAWAESELALETTTNEVGAILSKLNQLNFVEGASAAAASAPAASIPLATPAPDTLEMPMAPVPIAAAAPTAPEPLAAPPLAGELEVELGASGRSVLGHERPPKPAVAADLELGLAGASEEAKKRPQTGSGDAGIELGAAGFDEATEVAAEPAQAVSAVKGPSKELSTDLSQTFRIDKDDVKAAVRASKVMSAVNIPDDLKAEMEKLEASDAAAPVATSPAATPPPMPSVGSLSPAENPADDLSFQIGEEAQTSSGREAIVLPEEPARIAKREAAKAKAKEDSETGRSKPPTKAPARRSAPLGLWVLLLLVVLGGAGYYYMNYVRMQPDEKDTSAAKIDQIDRQLGKTEPAAPAAAPTSTLKKGEAPTAMAKASKAGVVGWVIPPGTEVAEGEILVKIAGFERYEREIERNQSSMDQYQARLESARDREDTAKIPGLEANVERKKGDVEAATAKRDAFVVKAPIAGVAEAIVELRARVAVDEEVASVTGQALSSASFTLPAGITAAEGDEMEIVSTTDPELKAVCTVSAAEGQEVTLSCPSDSGLEADAPIQLVL